MTDNPDRELVHEGWKCKGCDIFDFDLRLLAKRCSCSIPHRKTIKLIDQRELEKLTLQRNLLRNERDTFDRMFETATNEIAALRGELEEAKTSKGLSIAAKEAAYKDFGELQESKWRLDDKLAILKATNDKLRAGVKGTNKWRVSSSIEVQELLDYLDAILRDGVTCSICEQDELPASHVCPNGTEGGG